MERTRLQAICDTFLALRDFDQDVLSQWPEMRAFAAALDVPFIAILLLDQVGMLDQVLTPADLTVWQHWPGRTAWLDLVRQAAGQEARA